MREGQSADSGAIGYELTRAFDTNGSRYEEKENLRDWRTAAECIGSQTWDLAVREMVQV